MLALSHQRAIEERAFASNVAAQSMLTAMLDQETGVRGYAGTGDAEFLEPYRQGRAAFAKAVARAERTVTPDSPAARSLVAQRELARRWEQLARDQIRLARRHEQLEIPAALRRKRLMDSFRRENTVMRSILVASREADLRHSTRSFLAVVTAVTLLLVFAAVLIVRRAARRELRYRSGQQAFGDALQNTDSEHEAQLLLKRQVEALGSELEAIVLNRNNSENRLVAVTPLPESSALADALIDCPPRACLAVRRARAHGRTLGDEGLLRCEVCSREPKSSLCQPLIVGGEVIGSVVVTRSAPIGPRIQERIEESVAQAAPVLANLRNLELARCRAATDPLTGLPNRRTIADGLRRMLAHAARTDEPVSVVMLDLDHFKAINDRAGHDAGDEVLARAAAALRGRARDSDLVGRYGGEEFVLVLPDTDLDGAVALCEDLRAELHGITVDGVDRRTSGSFGVACYPRDGADAETLVRCADRALYAAKSAGRDRVVVAGAPMDASAVTEADAAARARPVP